MKEAFDYFESINESVYIHELESYCRKNNKKLYRIWLIEHQFVLTDKLPEAFKVVWGKQAHNFIEIFDCAIIVIGNFVYRKSVVLNRDNILMFEEVV